MKTRKLQRGGFILLVAVIWLVGGATGYMAIKVAQHEGAKEGQVITKIISGAPITDQEFQEAAQGKVTAVKVLTASGQVINAIEPSPDQKAVLSAYAMGAIEQGTQDAVFPTRPSASKLLPTDVTTQIPGCTSGTFACANGKAICRDKVCNHTNDCGDNSDEASNMCGAAKSCCQVTNGCPGETGSSCAATCCCCPYGQVCDRSNPGRGCISSSATLGRLSENDICPTGEARFSKFRPPDWQ